MWVSLSFAGLLLGQAGSGGLGPEWWGGVGIFDFWIFVFDGPGGRGGLRESWENKPHLQKRRFRRVLADSRCFWGALWRAGRRQQGAARGRGRSASGSRSAAAGPQPTHAVRRWSKPRAAARLQWPARSSRGRRSVALWAVGGGSGVPSTRGHICRPSASRAMPPGESSSYASRSEQR